MGKQVIIGECPVCGRPLVEGNSVNEHHLIPKSRKGKDTITLHIICHTKIHSVFSEKELEQYYHTVARIRSHPEIEKFIQWVKKKDPEFRDGNKTPRSRRK